MEYLEYKGYIGSIEYSPEDGVFHGKVFGTSALVSYEGNSRETLISDFHAAVDAYLSLANEFGKLRTEEHHA